jgi:hypothetical protein
MIDRYYSLCKLHVLHSQDLLVFSIAIPLTSKEDFNLYKLIPLPISTFYSRTYSFIKPHHPYLVLSATRSRFSKLKGLSSCEKISESLRLCYDMLLYFTAVTSDCEILLKTKKLTSIPDSCDVKTVNATIETKSFQTNGCLSRQNQSMLQLFAKTLQTKPKISFSRKPDF